MQKKLIGTMIIVIVGILIYAWSTTRNVQILQEMKASDFEKIEIWNHGESVVLTDQEDIQKFVDILHLHEYIRENHQTVQEDGLS